MSDLICNILKQRMLQMEMPKENATNWYKLYKGETVGQLIYDETYSKH